MVQATSPDGTIASRRQPHIGLSTDAGGQEPERGEHPGRSVRRSANAAHPHIYNRR